MWSGGSCPGFSDRLWASGGQTNGGACRDRIGRARGRWAYIMYVETRWSDNRMKAGRVARVRFSKTGRTLYLDGRMFEAIGMGEYRETESGESYWFSGPRKDGNDRKGVSRGVLIEIDEAVRREYWIEIRELPERADEATT
jgi:hypothetical protein